MHGMDITHCCHRCLQDLAIRTLPTESVDSEELARQLPACTSLALHFNSDSDDELGQRLDHMSALSCLERLRVYGGLCDNQTIPATLARLTHLDLSGATPPDAWEYDTYA